MEGRAVRTTDLLIVGAGPAGLSAALAAAQAGVKALVIDENQRPGGQLFKQIHKFFGSGVHKAGTRGFRIGEQLLAETLEQHVEVQLGYPVYGLFPDGHAVCGSPEGAQEIRARKIILATGANENNLCFEGSTLPGVMTAGAAQTMINLHHVLPGQRVVMIGSGNVGLIVAYQLLQAGAQVAAVVEAAPAIGGYGVHANKLRRAGVPFFVSHTVHRAIGTDGVEGVELVRLDNFRKVDGTQQLIPCDTVCMAVGLTPMVELARLAGCEMTEIPALGGVVPMHDENMRTTNPDVYIAGDISGVEEASTAMEEGRLAGTAAAEALGALDADTAARLKDEIRSRMALLRSGEFGAKRQAAKQTITQRCAAFEAARREGGERT